jgi:hypothetical protein
VSTIILSGSDVPFIPPIRRAYMDIDAEDIAYSMALKFKNGEQVWKTPREAMVHWSHLLLHDAELFIRDVRVVRASAL